MQTINTNKYENRPAFTGVPFMKGAVVATALSFCSLANSAPSWASVVARKEQTMDFSRATVTCTSRTGIVFEGYERTPLPKESKSIGRGKYEGCEYNGKLGGGWDCSQR